MPDGKNRINVENNPALLKILMSSRHESDKAFLDMAKKLRNEEHVCFELLLQSDGGAHRLIKI